MRNKSKIYQPITSDFTTTTGNILKQTTHFYPRIPYAFAKLYA